MDYSIYMEIRQLKFFRQLFHHIIKIGQKTGEEKARMF